VIRDALGSSYGEGGERKSRRQQHVGGERGVCRGREQWIYGGAAEVSEREESVVLGLQQQAVQMGEAGARWTVQIWLHRMGGWVFLGMDSCVYMNFMSRPCKYMPEILPLDFR
jgi:hypothetical protein